MSAHAGSTDARTALRAVSAYMKDYPVEKMMRDAKDLPRYPQGL